MPGPTSGWGASSATTAIRRRNYALETLPGLYVCGTVYAPLARGRHPLVVSPAGHWEGGRYRPDQQLRMATFARMGAVAVDMDIFGWGDSERQVGREAHTTVYAMQMQVLWSKAVTRWIVSARRDIDTTRMAATGGSGGATHALLLAVVEPRFAVLAPVVHLVSHFDGGCPCESGRPVALAAGGSCMPEILAAAMAPKPVLTVSDGGDWTATYPVLEYPYLQRIWGLCGAAERVENAHFSDERHDYGVNKRRAVYEFFARTLGLDLARADETRVSVQPEEALRSFADGLPAGAVHSREELEAMLGKLEKTE
ncbi:S9 family peptidase [uncultured Alistipes sp.]|uniref:alpha/beta hydrolase family protein n=1 Tax=uncultured Alistipes sp. TaxID=538949 RepID=UPI0025DC651C|nr:CocE/NonD family hydrolase [uncultured Alistipes sp.]